MRLEHAVSIAVERLLGRVMRRTAAVAVMAILVLGAIYQFSVAGVVALSEFFGPVYGRLLVAGGDVVLVLLIFAVLYATRAKPAPTPHPASGASKDARMAMLIESILLGFELARGKKKR